MTTGGVMTGGSHIVEQARGQASGVAATEAPERTLNDGLRRMITNPGPLHPGRHHPRSENPLPCSGRPLPIDGARGVAESRRIGKLLCATGAPR